jgi:hypothetical protein
MHTATHPRVFNDTPAPVLVALAVTLALGIAGAVTIASGTGLTSEASSAAARTGEPAVTQLNRRRKGDRLDRASVPAERPGLDSDGARPPEMIVPKIVPAAPAADPVRLASRAQRRG